MRLLPLFIVSLLFSFSTQAQTLLHTEDFEDDSNGSEYRANEFNDNSSDIWTRSENSNNGPNNNTEHVYSGYVGLDWWCGEDIDASDNPFSSPNNNGYLMVKTLDVSAYQGDSIQLQVYLAGNTGTIKRYRANDYLQLKYAFNGDIATGANSVGSIPTQANLLTGTYTIFAAFYGSGNSVGTSSALIQDLDLDGVSEGSQGPADSLKNAFAEWTFTFPIGVSDTTVSILFQARTSGGSEEIGIDHIRVFAKSGGSPAPTVALTVDQNVTCNGGSDGAITATITPGTPNYDYVWSTGATTLNTSSTTDQLTGLSSGVYTVTITDNSGNTSTSSVSISQPTAVAATATTTSNVSCNGGSDGVIVGSASNGTGPYTYLWSNGTATATNSGLAAGTYIVTVTDANGCTDVAFDNVSQPSFAVLASITGQTNVTTNGGSDGSITAAGSGGTSPYTYSWNNAATTATASTLSAGTYSVTVSDANGCTDSASATITQPAPSVTGSITSSTNVTCNGGSDGSATVTASSGSTPYTYLWSNAATTATVTGLSAGTYTVTVTDAAASTATDQVTISEPTAIAATGTTTTDISCFGDSDGALTASASNGTSPYTYAWSNGATTAINSGISSGTYTVTVTDANGCTGVASPSITDPAQLFMLANPTSHVSCFGGSDGAGLVTLIGGTPSYTFLWSSGGTSNSESGLAAGIYSVTVTDGNGCTATDTTEIFQPSSGPSVSITSQTNVTNFGGNDGSLTATAGSGGTSPYTYAWSNAASTATISTLTAGTYSVTLTDANGCTDSTSATITQPGPLTGSVISSTNVSCFGGNDGSATASASGGTSPYTYLWSNAATTASISSLTAGVYTVTITDAASSTVTDNVSITEPTAVAATATVSSHVNCFGGSDGVIVGSASNGTGSFTYLWSNGTTTATNSGLAAGTYTLTVTDANGCTDVATETVNQPSTGVSVSISSQTNVSTFGGNDGSATASASGGTPSYTYSWSNAATSATISSLSAGTYSVTVSDVNGCTDVTSVTISQPSAVSAAISSSTNVDCNGASTGSATVTTSTGTAPFTYLWSNAATTATITGLSAGTYTVTVTDATSGTATDQVTITEPTAVVATANVNSDVSCNGGSDGELAGSASGGTGAYTYLWSNGATTATISGLTAGSYTLTVTDANGCTDVTSNTVTEPTAVVASISSSSNVTCFGGSDGSATAAGSGGTPSYTYAWSNGATSSTVSGLASGTYSVTVTDANGCTDSASVVISDPSAPVTAATTVDNNVSCNGFSDGGATASATGGTPTYNYVWSNGGTSASISSLSVGTYSVTATDANGCTDVASVTITEPNVIGGTTTVDNNVSCNGGSDGGATISLTGGTMPYTYLWSNGGTNASTTGLAAGTHSVAITDANGCTGLATVTITEPTALLATSTVDSNASCNGFNDGGATASASGGTSPYTYNWSNSATTASITGVGAGTYSVTVTDANGCTDSSSVTITEPTAIVLSTTVNSNVSCNGLTDGDATVSASGGTGPYTYLWSNSSTAANLTGVGAGLYFVTVTDANGCTETAGSLITQPAVLISASSVDNNVSCNGLADGQASAAAVGGTSPYTYLWSNAGTTSTVNGLAAGTYSVTVTDDNGCTDSSSVIITDPDVLLANVAVLNNINCNGLTDGSAKSTPTGGSFPYSFVWSNGNPTATANGLAVGTYSVTVTDVNGCTDSGSISITEPTALALTQTTTDITCNGAEDGAVDITVTGGTMAYTYFWSNGDTTEDLTGLAGGNYYVTVSDANGCTITSLATLAEPAQLVALGATSNVTCDTCTGSIDLLSVLGGTTPYTYAWSNGETTEDISGLAAGTYTVTVTDANGCTETFSFSISNTVGVVNYEALTAPVKVFPNPAREMTTVVIPQLVNSETVNFEVFDLVGHRVFAREGLQVNQELVFNIEVSTWSPGAFIYRVYTDNTTLQTGRLMIVK